MRIGDFFSFSVVFKMVHLIINRILDSLNYRTFGRYQNTDVIKAIKLWDHSGSKHRERWKDGPWEQNPGIHIGLEEGKRLAKENKKGSQWIKDKARNK